LKVSIFSGLSRKIEKLFMSAFLRTVFSDFDKKGKFSVISKS
jgi:hypothetical protein